MLHKLRSINGYHIQAKDGKIGVVKDCLFDDQNWVIRYLVVNTERWIPGGKKVLISPVSVTGLDSIQETVQVSLTYRQVEDSPSLEDHQPVSRQYEASLFRYYGYAFYWMGPELWGTYPHPAPLADAPAQDSKDALDQQGDPHLRSVNEVCGYRVATLDDYKGHIEDVIVEDEGWRIEFIQINTRNFLPGGRDVLVTMDCIEHISWPNHSLSIGLSSKQLTSGSEWDEQSPSESWQKSALHCD
ncbi:MAG: PRC-barrel domain-containing protein [Porticoccaceae bacterium]